MRKQITDVPLTYLIQIFDMLFKEEKNIKLAVHPKLAVEMAFIRISQIQPALSLDTLVEKIDLLQKGIAETAFSNIGKIESQSSKATMIISGQEDVVDNSSFSSENQMPRLENLSMAEDKDKKITSLNSPENKSIDIASPHGSQAMAREESIENSWEKILDGLSRQYPILAACFTESKVSETNSNQIVIEFVTNQFNINYAHREDNQLFLKKTWSDYLGRNIQLSLQDKLAPTGASQEKKREKRQLQDEAINHPLVAKAVKLFNGKIVDIKII